MAAPPNPTPPAPARRSRARVVIAAVLIVAVILGAVIAYEELPGLTAPARTFHMTGLSITYVGSGAGAMCTASGPGSSICQSGVIACPNGTTPCAQPLRTGESFSDTNGVAFSAVLTDTFDCNYTYSIAQVSAPSGAFEVSGAAVDGAALPVNLGFTGPGSDCLTNATITVGFAVGNQGPTNQTFDLNVLVTQELR